MDEAVLLIQPGREGERQLRCGRLKGCESCAEHAAEGLIGQDRSAQMYPVGHALTSILAVPSTAVRMARRAASACGGSPGMAVAVHLCARVPHRRRPPGKLQSARAIRPARPLSGLALRPARDPARCLRLVLAVGLTKSPIELGFLKQHGEGVQS